MGLTVLGRLKREAIEACTNRGHSMGKFTNSIYKGQSSAKCEDCGMGVFVDTHPLPNGIDCSGDAVALTCKKNIGFTNIAKLKAKHKKEISEAIKLNNVITFMMDHPVLRDTEIVRISPHTAYANYFVQIESETLHEAMDYAERMNPLNIYLLRDGCLSIKPETAMQEAFEKFPDGGTNRQGYKLINPYAYYIGGLAGRDEKELRWFVAIDEHVIEMRCKVLNDPDTRRSYSISNHGNYIKRDGTKIINNSGYFGHVITWGGSGDHPNNFTLY